MDIERTIIVFDKLLEVLGLVEAKKIEKTKEVDNALSKLYEAIVETKAYLRSSSENGPDREQEKKLAKLWFNTAVPLRHIDETVASICSSKSGFWADPEAWDYIQAGDYNISIGNVESLTHELLIKK